MQQVERWWPEQETAGARAGKGLLKRRDVSVSQIPRAEWLAQHSDLRETGECTSTAREQFEAAVVRTVPIVCVGRRWTVVPVRMCNGIRMRVALMGVAIQNRLDQHPACRAREAW